MKKSKIVNIFLSSIIVILLIAFVFVQFKQSNANTLTTETVSVKPVNAQILAQGSVESENQADLHFTTSGKLTTLPFKEGDTIYAGQTIAALDSYPLQKQLQQSYLGLSNAQITADQVQENYNAGVLEGQQRVALDMSNKSAYTKETEADIIASSVKRVLQQSSNATNAQQIAIDLANYAIQLATLTAPFNGIVTHEDVTSTGVNVGPTTTFSIADPNTLILRVYVSETDINYIAVDSPATIQLNGNDNKTITGSVKKIYPQKKTLASGENVYQVDIASDALKQNAVLKQGGSVLIANKLHNDVMLLPAWTVLNNNTVWVIDGNKTIMKHVVVGDTIGSNVEIRSGLSATDKVVTNPKTVIKNEYLLL